MSIDINDDSEVEDTESFFVNITTTDDHVTILVDSAQVLIGDNGKLHCSCSKIIENKATGYGISIQFTEVCSNNII